MTSTVDARTASAPVTTTAVLDRFAHITPNWFTTVMGTGIVAVAAAGVPGVRIAATGVWLVASAMLVAVSVAFVVHWARHPALARGYARHATMSHFYGAPAMAMLTVGAGTVLYGAPIIGARAAVVVDAALWVAGTLVGVATMAVIAVRLVRRDDRGGAALPARMMSVVAPMVSASTAALLASHLAPGATRDALIATGYAMFLLSLVAGTATAVAVYRRMIRVGLPVRAAVPTVWIPLGMMGQSITAAITLGAVTGDALHTAGMWFGVVMAVVAAAAGVTALAITVHAATDGLPFSMTWWSFTFPVGTCVTGATALANATGLSALHDVAIAGFVGLVAAWAVVSARTVAALIRGELPAAA